MLGKQREQALAAREAWQRMWQEFLQLPVKTKIFVIVGVLLVMNVVFSNVVDFIFAALGAVLVQYAWPSAFTHLKNMAKSAELFKAGEQASAEGSPPRQEGLSKESTHANGDDLKDIEQIDRGAPRDSGQPNDLMREAQNALQKKSHGSSYEDSKNTARANSLLQKIIGKYPNSKEAKKARALLDKLQGKGH